MKTAISVVLVCVLALSVMPAGASDTFQAFRTLPSADQAILAPLPDDQLAAVEGGWGVVGQSFDIVSSILANLVQLGQIGQDLAQQIIQDVAQQISQIPAQVSTESVTVIQVNDDLGSPVQSNIFKVNQYQTTP